MYRYQVVRAFEIDAESPLEAAFLAYKMQKGEMPAAARFCVSSEGSTPVDVSIGDISPVEILTERERTVAELITTGATNAYIARQLQITERTVKSHVSNIFGKLHVSSRIHVATKLIRVQREFHAAV